MYKKRRRLLVDKKAVTSVIETIIATAIIFTVLVLFYTSINSLYYVHVRSDIDLQAKCDNVCEMFVSSPGEESTYQLNWEDGDVDVVSTVKLGLATTPTLAYGTFLEPVVGDVEIVSYYDFFLDDVVGGDISSCFLAGTEIVTADGSYKNIEDVDAGDMVKSFDTKTGSIVNSRVTNVFHHSPSEMTRYYLVINEFLKVTPNHLLCHDGQWIYFDQIVVGDTINNIVISSVEKVFEKMPTFDLEVEENHNYFIWFSDVSFLVHNEDPPDFIDWMPWVATSKDVLLQKNIDDVDYYFGSYGRDYYVECEHFDATSGVYEVKGKLNYPYPVLDSQKIDKLIDGPIPYSGTSDVENAKSILGLEGEYAMYGFSLTISSVHYTPPETYGATLGFEDVVVSTTRNVLIYHPPAYPDPPADPLDDYEDFDDPFYETGQVIVRMFLGGYVPED